MPFFLYAAFSEFLKTVLKFWTQWDVLPSSLDVEIVEGNLLKSSKWSGQCCCFALLPSSLMCLAASDNFEWLLRPVVSIPQCLAYPARSKQFLCPTVFITNVFGLNNCFFLSRSLLTHIHGSDCLREFLKTCQKRPQEPYKDTSGHSVRS